MGWLMQWIRNKVDTRSVGHKAPQPRRIMEMDKPNHMRNKYTDICQQIFDKSKENGLSNTSSASVTIVGAGLSGLVCGLLLKETSLNVNIVEASDEVGGRVKTKYINYPIAQSQQKSPQEQKQLQVSKEKKDNETQKYQQKNIRAEARSEARLVCSMITAEETTNSLPLEFGGELIGRAHLIFLYLASRYGLGLSFADMPDFIPNSHLNAVNNPNGAPLGILYDQRKEQKQHKVKGKEKLNEKIKEKEKEKEEEKEKEKEKEKKKDEDGDEKDEKIKKCFMDKHHLLSPVIDATEINECGRARRLSAEALEGASFEVERVLDKISRDAEQVKYPGQPWLENKEVSQWDFVSVANKFREWELYGLPARLLQMEFENDNLCDLSHLSYLSLLCNVKAGTIKELGTFWDNVENYRCARGNQLLAKKMQENITTVLTSLNKAQINTKTNYSKISPHELGELDASIRTHAHISTNTSALAVTQNTGNKMKTHTSCLVSNKRQILVSDFVVVTTPPTVWDSIAFTLINSLPFDINKYKVSCGPASKFVSQLKKRFWLDIGLSSDGLSSEIGQTWEANECRFPRDSNKQQVRSKAILKNLTLNDTGNRKKKKEYGSSECSLASATNPSAEKIVYLSAFCGGKNYINLNKASQAHQNQVNPNIQAKDQIINKTKTKTDNQMVHQNDKHFHYRQKLSNLFETKCVPQNAHTNYTENLIETTLIDWPNNIHIRTGYSYGSLGQINSKLRFLNEPVKSFNDRLIFAGEHTSTEYMGYMEGALASGIRAAFQIINMLGNNMFLIPKKVPNFRSLIASSKSNRATTKKKKIN